ncbi:MAG: response regulator, partial [Deltaproteobacteria bacterium]|nr:response regulator [Deltaproteobacteria bacterium]
GLDSKDAIFDCLARALMELEPGVIIVLSDVVDKKITIRSLRGIGDRMRRLMEILGQDPMGMSFDLIFFDEPGYTEGEVLVELEGGLYEISSGKFPRVAAAAAEKMLGFGRMFSGALNWGGRMRGNVTLAVRGKGDLASPDVVRVLLRMASSALYRLEVVEGLRRSEKTMRAFVDGFADVAFMTDAEGRIIVLNEALASIFKKSVDEMVGACIFDLLPEELAASRRQRHEEAVRTGKVVRFEDEIRGRTFENSVYPILDAEGRASRFAILVREVTEQRRTDQELLRAQKVESMGVLAGGIAHDFNNLLSAILGNVSLAKMSLKGQSEALELLEESEAACHRASGLTRQLLTFSSGGEPITKRASIENLVRESAGFALRGSNVKVEFDVDEDLWSVQVDRGQIGQAVGNLVINADQAMPRGGVLRIAIRNKLFAEPNALGMPPGGYIEVAIEDHGTGISRENLPLVFDPYFTTKQKGSGLGLSSAYSIVKRHGGVLTVESDEGEGATFHIYLRASREAPERPSLEPGQVCTGSGRILVMDDEEAVRKVTGRMLEKLGYVHAFARDGEDALAAYAGALESGNRFDAVIMDLTVPGAMGGLEAVSKLLELDSEARVIVSSGYSNDPVMADHRKHGFRGVVVKPVRMDVLSEVLETLLR